MQICRNIHVFLKISIITEKLIASPNWVLNDNLFLYEDFESSADKPKFAQWSFDSDPTKTPTKTVNRNQEKF